MKPKKALAALIITVTVACFALYLIVKHADWIDGVEPEIPQYEAVWRGIIVK
jgi:hypothetical protein